MPIRAVTSRNPEKMGLGVVAAEAAESCRDKGVKGGTQIDTRPAWMARRKTKGNAPHFFFWP